MSMLPSSPHLWTSSSISPSSSSFLSSSLSSSTYTSASFSSIVPSLGTDSSQEMESQREDGKEEHRSVGNEQKVSLGQLEMKLDHLLEEVHELRQALARQQLFHKVNQYQKQEKNVHTSNLLTLPSPPKEEEASTPWQTSSLSPLTFSPFSASIWSPNIPPSPSRPSSRPLNSARFVRDPSSSSSGDGRLGSTKAASRRQQASSRAVEEAEFIDYITSGPARSTFGSAFEQLSCNGSCPPAVLSHSTQVDAASTSALQGPRPKRDSSTGRCKPSNDFVAILVNGSSCPFSKSHFKQGIQGGKDVASLLHHAVGTSKSVRHLLGKPTTATINLNLNPRRRKTSSSYPWNEDGGSIDGAQTHQDRQSANGLGLRLGLEDANKGSFFEPSTKGAARPGASSSSPSSLPTILLGDLHNSEDEDLDKHLDVQIHIMVFYDMETLQQRFETDRGFQVSRDEILAFAKGLNDKANAAMLGFANYEETERKMDEWIAFLSLMQECKLVAVSPSDADRALAIIEKNGGEQAKAKLAIIKDAHCDVTSAKNAAPHTILCDGVFAHKRESAASSTSLTSSSTEAEPVSSSNEARPAHERAEREEDADDDDVILAFPSLFYDTSSSATSLTASPPTSFFDSDEISNIFVDDGCEIDALMHSHSCEDCCKPFDIPTLVIGENGVDKMLMMEDSTQTRTQEGKSQIPVVSLPSAKKPTNAPIDTTVQKASAIDAVTLPSPATSINSNTSISASSTTSFSTACSEVSSPATVTSELQMPVNEESELQQSNTITNSKTSTPTPIPPSATCGGQDVSSPKAQAQLIQTCPAKPSTTTVIVKQETFRVYSGSRKSLLLPKATRHPDRTKPFAKQVPMPPCNRHYLLPQGCPAPDCQYSHDFLLTCEDLDKLRTDSKRTPCAFLMRFTSCEAGKDCHMGHICPHGRGCTYGDRCKFTLDGMHDGPAILPPLQYRPKSFPAPPAPFNNNNNAQRHTALPAPAIPCRPAFASNKSDVSTSIMQQPGKPSQSMLASQKATFSGVKQVVTAPPAGKTADAKAPVAAGRTTKQDIAEHVQRTTINLLL